MSESGRDGHLTGLTAPFLALLRVGAAAAGLMRSEAALAKAEAAQAAGNVMRGVVMAVIAAIIAIVGLNMLAEAAVDAMIFAGLAPHWARLAGAAGLLLIALILVLVAKSKFNASGKMSRHVGDRVSSNMALLRREMRRDDV